MEVQSSQLTVVIVEDHPIVRDALASALTGSSLNVDIIYNGASVAEASAAIESANPDVVLLDLDLGPNAEPITNVATLAALGSPVLIVSGILEAPMVRGALIAGARGYCSKNASVAELLEAVEVTAQGEEFISHELGSVILSKYADTVSLSEQERRAMVLYASGMKMAAVARAMGISLGTAQEYVKRVRAKYLAAGTQVSTKTELYKAARDDGFLS